MADAAETSSGPAPMQASGKPKLAALLSRPSRLGGSDSPRAKLQRVKSEVITLARRASDATLGENSSGQNSVDGQAPKGSLARKVSELRSAALSTMSADTARLLDRLAHRFIDAKKAHKVVLEQLVTEAMVAEQEPLPGPAAMAALLDAEDVALEKREMQELFQAFPAAPDVRDAATATASKPGAPPARVDIFSLCAALDRAMVKCIALKGLHAPLELSTAPRAKQAAQAAPNAIQCMAADKRKAAGSPLSDEDREAIIQMMEQQLASSSLAMDVASLQELVATMELSAIKMPTGTAALYINVAAAGPAGGFSVPCWSLRAMASRRQQRDREEGYSAIVRQASAKVASANNMAVERAQEVQRIWDERGARQQHEAIARALLVAAQAADGYEVFEQTKQEPLPLRSASRRITGGDLAVGGRRLTSELSTRNRSTTGGAEIPGGELAAGRRLTSELSARNRSTTGGTEILSSIPSGRSEQEAAAPVTEGKVTLNVTS